MLRTQTTSQSNSTHSAQRGLTQSDGVQKRGSAVIEKRKKRHSKTPAHEKIPGLEISDNSTENLEYLISTGIGQSADSTAAEREWRIKAAHTLSARFIEGDMSLSEHKAPCDHVKAYAYAEIEINTMSIEELEAKFFNLDSPNNVFIMPWQNVENISRIISKNKESIREQNKKITLVSFKNADSIKKFIHNDAKWNEELNKDKAADSSAIISAWEKQLAVIRLAKHYRQLKKEKRDIQSALAAKFYKEAVTYLAEHEAPTNWLTTILLKIISPRFNSIRLFIIRLNKFLTQFNAPLLVKPFFRWLATIAGLYFLIVLLVDISVLLRAFFRNAKGEYDLGDNLPAFSLFTLGVYITALIDAFKKGWARLTLAFWEDNRPSRMANDSLWFSINFTCLMLTLFVAPPLAALWIAGLTIAGCLFDLGAEIMIGAYSFKKINELRAAIRSELDTLTDIDITKKFSAQEMANDPIGTKEYKQKIIQKKSSLEADNLLVKKRTALELNRTHVVMIMAVLTIAAAILFFPPAAMPLAPIIAATTAFVMGSVFGGLGKYLFWNAPDFYKSGKESALKGLRTIREWAFGKIKQPIYSQPTADDLNIHSTKHINSRFAMRAAVTLDNAHQTDLTNAQPPLRTNCNLLHRSPSGTLFIDNRVERPEAIITDHEPAYSLK